MIGARAEMNNSGARPLAGIFDSWEIDLSKALQMSETTADLSR